MATEPDPFAEELRLIVAEARRLLEEQRRALRNGDFAGLLSTTGGFHRLAAGLGTLRPAALPRDSEREIRRLREDVARQSQLVEITLAATVPPTRGYSRKPTPQSARSLLLDQYR